VTGVIKGNRELGYQLASGIARHTLIHAGRIALTTLQPRINVQLSEISHTCLTPCLVSNEATKQQSYSSVGLASCMASCKLFCQAMQSNSNIHHTGEAASLPN
jgi:hypothetical protein